jgi:hypothetical protein
MKIAIAGLGALALGALSPSAAFAQESPAGDSTVDQESPLTQSEADALAQTSAQPPDAQPPAPPPPPSVQTPDAPQGQWVYQADYGWTWIPVAATTYAIGADPYVYLFTPAYGWTWYLSPWGAGAYSPGPWLYHHLGLGPRVWVSGRLIAPAHGVRYGGAVHLRAGASHGGGSPHGAGRR